MILQDQDALKKEYKYNVFLLITKQQHISKKE